MFDINNPTINGDVFIIPNTAGKIHNFMEFSRERILNNMVQICESVNIPFNPMTDYVIETWSCSNELECDNIADHGIFTETKDGKACRIEISDRYLPANIFMGKKEGEIVTFKMPITIRVANGPKPRYYENDPIITEATFNLTMAQRKYRYRNHGDFEEVMARVIAAQARYD